MIAAAVAERPSALKSDNTPSMRAAEMAVAVLVWGWSFEEAHLLIGGDPDRARRRIRGDGKLPYIPTPDQIAAECRRLRRWPAITCNKDGE